MSLWKGLEQFGNEGQCHWSQTLALIVFRSCAMLRSYDKSPLWLGQISLCVPNVSSGLYSAKKTFANQTTDECSSRIFLNIIGLNLAYNMSMWLGLNIIPWTFIESQIDVIPISQLPMCLRKETRAHRDMKLSHIYLLRVQFTMQLSRKFHEMPVIWFDQSSRLSHIVRYPNEASAEPAI